jgi:flagellum-specific ATP synthase
MVETSAIVPDWSRYHRAIAESTPLRAWGRVAQVVGLVVEGVGPAVSVGESCDIGVADPTTGRYTWIRSEVVGFRANNKVLLTPLGGVQGIVPGSPIVARRKPASVEVGPEWIGRVVDGLGHPLDSQGPLNGNNTALLYNDPPNPLDRPRIQEPLDLGVRAINALLTVGRGQRMGIFAGSGVGKSVLLGMIARYAKADVNVIALIGERGREVREFLERDLGEEGMARSVVVVATSDTSPLVRRRGALLATAVAEYFRSQGRQVLLMMDSLTRLAMAQREIGLAAGEPPTARGYTPSAFALLPQLLERAGTAPGGGSITGLYSVLAEGDDSTDPVVDTARSILDGHIWLSRDLAAKNHFPAVDVLQSISRVMPDIVGEEHRSMASRVRHFLASYQEVEMLVNIGAYARGSNVSVDEALDRIEPIRTFLRQGMNESVNLEQSLEAMEQALESDSSPPAPFGNKPPSG